MASSHQRIRKADRKAAARPLNREQPRERLREELCGSSSAGRGSQLLLLPLIPPRAEAASKTDAICPVTAY
jgi:hypothetical protein